MLKEEFDFTLDEALWVFNGDKDAVYHAKLNSNKSSYDVFFKEDGELLYKDFPKEKLEQYIEKGLWIVQ